MTERTNDLDRTERIRRLQERRVASGTPGGVARPIPAETSGVRRPAGSSTRPRRRHPAAGTRWLLTAVSATSFVAIGGTVALANRATGAVASPAPAVSPAPAPTSRSGQAGAATPAANPASVVHTTTRGS